MGAKKFLGSLAKGVLKGVPIIGGLVDSVIDMLGDGLDPAAKAALLQAKEANRYKLEELELAHQTAQIDAVNATMRAEAKSEHWMQWTWRPLIGYTFAATVINNYVLMPWFPSIPAITIPDPIWYAMLSILGVSAGFRGWQKVKDIMQKEK